jgi:hypothetical protein
VPTQVSLAPYVGEGCLWWQVYKVPVDRATASIYGSGVKYNILELAKINCPHTHRSIVEAAAEPSSVVEALVNCTFGHSAFKLYCPSCRKMRWIL